MRTLRSSTGLLALAITADVGAGGHMASVKAQEAKGAGERLERETDIAARNVYSPADFARFAPRTALDLIEQIPGFDVSNSESGRGFGQANENLLINGKRVSSKSTSTADQLARIPVGNVVRIELVDGATLDIPGLSGRVANIIVEQGTASGLFEWRPQLSTGPAEPRLFEGEISLTGTMEAVDYTIALDNNASSRGSRGPAIFTDASGVIDDRTNLAKSQYNSPTLNGSFALDIAPQIIANINVSAGLEIFRSREREGRTAGNPLPSFEERFRTTNDKWNYEIGGDITFPLGPGQLKLIALDAFEDGDLLSRSLLEQDDEPTSGTRYTRASETGERIGRGEYNWGMLGAEWQLSAEVAFNRLDQVGRLFSYDPAAQDYVETVFPSGTGGVREDRYETLLSVSFPITPRLSLQLAGGGEYSQISQTGANALSRSFQRPKGSFNLGWAPSDGLDINVEIARRVGQLNFEDFLASVDLSDDQASAGNNDLRPPQNWDIQLEIAKGLGPWGSATLTFFEERVEDLVLIVPVAGGGEASGNIDDARRTGLNLNGTLLFEPLGAPGAQLEIELELEDSQVVDPVTAIERRFDGNNPFELRFDFRHDVPASFFAWGATFVNADRAANYRVREFFFDHQRSTFGAVFVEHKNLLGTTMQVRLGNVFDGVSTLRRTVYDGPRDTAPVRFTENRRRKSGQSINFTISGNF
ncbi:TonB-dependent receptor plug domain-containing protein [Aurantiacibacter atlanticus]|uniref:TonB-dependent receptor plug domain-containing protein n=1 Tax=Aurantiacibacter atlanticus TaxID=1648404 RepID=UPI0013731CCD|nr:TonB-dependent receptor plug domain-containing protein [Aurantiacibacter atlanticus]